jgi:hypothetical protein
MNATTATAARFTVVLHAHYCAACEGFSTCAGPGPFVGTCLLVEPCIRCWGPVDREPVAIS